MSSKLCQRIYCLDHHSNYRTKSNGIIFNYFRETLFLTVVLLNVTQEETVYNAVSALYAMVRIPTCREMMSRPPVNADNHLMRLSQIDNPRLKANCSRTLKNLASDSNEALEEGSVSAMIAMSLEVIFLFLLLDFFSYSFFEFMNRGKSPKLEMRLRCP